MIRHRGYDSCGMATLSASGNLEVTKVCSLNTPANCFERLRESVGTKHLESGLGIAHTRWATMGKPSDANAHPHYDLKKRIALVHNGTATNTRELFNDVHKRLSTVGNHVKVDMNNEFVPKEVVECPQSDSEAIAHLIGYEFDACKDIHEAFRRVISRLKGSWAICMISTMHPESLFIARHGCPLLVAKSPKRNGFYVASETCVFMNDANDFIPLEDGDLFNLTTTVLDDLYKTRKIYTVDKRNISKSPAPYTFWLMKEIAEQPLVSRIIVQHFKFLDKTAPIVAVQEKYQNTNDVTLDQKPESLDYELKLIDLLNWEPLELYIPSLSRDVLDCLVNTRRLNIIACGSSRHTGLYVANCFHKFDMFDIFEVDDASDLTMYRYKLPCTCIFISQSGETLDTLNACEFLKEYCPGVVRMAVTNSLNSSLNRMCDFAMHLKIGVECSVASTKSFMSQLVTCTIICAYVLSKRNTNGQYNDAMNEIKMSLLKLGSSIKSMICNEELYCKIAGQICNKVHVFVLGKGPAYPICIEGALKLKEIAYVYAEGIGAAQMKHGSLATISTSDGTPAICIILSQDYEASVNAAKQLKARGAYIIAITDDPSLIQETADDIIQIPPCGIFTAAVALVPIQIIAYKVALLKNINPDTPRGLAKSVTVI
ncbi:bifunctional SIS domain/SIS domain superfamily/Glucosamine-fructose-6-phosphate aminotransferase [Babesia duncani]|uniref:glutamine--fructose-6-phosphate transaminase (isomerizing) n=1 Tax=Babesia duncani TaxID=323732 RepID=A0AAD9UQB4_9APIC|nr:bifunctional SIS domain/SIS domain superfamily/Glucosamine-fructose-6-phosphate aminotransferase [Babesia duncani]